MPSLLKASLCCALLRLAAPLALAADAAASCSLDAVLAAARLRSPELLAAAALGDMGAADRAGVLEHPNPEIEFALGDAEADDGTRGSETSWSFVQPLESPGRRRARRALGESAIAAADAESAEATAAALAGIRRAWFALLYAERERDLLREQADSLRQTQALIARRAEAGEAAGVEVLRARVEGMRLEREAALSDAAAIEARARLESLIGEALPGRCRLEAPPVLPDPGTDRDGFLALVEESSPEIRSARAALERSDAALRLERRRAAPDLALGVFGLNEIDKSALGGSLGLQIPLWSRNRGEIARRSVESRLFGYALESARFRVRGRASAVWNLFVLSRGQQDALRDEIIPASSEALQITRLAYEQGAVDLTDLLDAGRAHTQTHREALEAARLYREAETSLLSLRGDLR